MFKCVKVCVVGDHFLCASRSVLNSLTCVFLYVTSIVLKRTFCWHDKGITNFTQIFSLLCSQFIVAPLFLTVIFCSFYVLFMTSGGKVRGVTKTSWLAVYVGTWWKKRILSQEPDITRPVQTVSWRAMVQKMVGSWGLFRLVVWSVSIYFVSWFISVSTN